MNRIDEEVLRYLFLMRPVQEEEQVREIERRQQRQQAEMVLSGAGDGSPAVKTVVRTSAKVGRNQPCPCGSGKKYKKCHGAGGMRPGQDAKLIQTFIPDSMPGYGEKQRQASSEMPNSLSSQEIDSVTVDFFKKSL